MYSLILTAIALFFFFLGFASHAKQPDQDCINWFKAGKINTESKNCEIECATLITDLSTFICPDQCELLCKSKPEMVSNIVGKFIYYPGLTPAEKRLVERNPKDALVVFVQKVRAEQSSSRNFPDQDLNDEGDAFRHFIWAGLLTKELGALRAKEFLDAHEANPLQPDAERVMDEFNNEKSSQSAQKLISNKNWSLENLEKSGLDSLKSKNLKVLSPGLKIPEVPK